MLFIIIIIIVIIIGVVRKFRIFFSVLLSKILSTNHVSDGNDCGEMIMMKTMKILSGSGGGGSGAKSKWGNEKIISHIWDVQWVTRLSTNKHYFSA